MSKVIVRGLRRAALPLACYYAITLGLPLINGAGRVETTFVYHALAVLVVPLVLVALATATLTVVRRPADHLLHQQSRLSSHSRVSRR